MTAPVSVPVPALSRQRQTLIGLGTSLLIVLAWLVLHVGAVWHLDAPAHPILAAFIFVALTWLSVGLFIIAHDAMHGAVAPGRPRLNAAIGTLTLALYAGFSFRRMIVQHMRHHRSPGSDDDPDFAPGGPVRWYVAFVRQYFGWREFWLLGSATVLYALILGDRWPYVLFWALPSILASVQLFVFGTWMPHRRDDTPFPDRHNARSPRMNDLASLLSCYHFGGYHHEHHLYPTVPWWRLPRTRLQRSAG
ncbi:fatty acid desaturase [uncultured Paracoccus sp.]|uniref:fatty acid desaturase n=1 Tax=uncultured Paracoccus sp. TaxID=189685 RepID=UPI00260755CE|nr:fatty acid desaturase [uncultured Paracoccus sp.]